MTPIHTVRVPDDLWQAAMARARADETNLATVIRRFLMQYATGSEHLSPFVVGYEYGWADAAGEERP